MKAGRRFRCIGRPPDHLAVDIHSVAIGVDGTEEWGIKRGESKRPAANVEAALNATPSAHILITSTSLRIFLSPLLLRACLVTP